MMSSKKADIGRMVEISANGMTYKGILKAMTETEIYLKSPTKTWAIPVDRVRKMSVIEERPRESKPEQPFDLGLMDQPENDEDTEPK